MTHLRALCVQVSPPFRHFGGDYRDLIDDREVVPIVNERVGFLGVIGEQANLGKTEVFENLQTDSVVAQVGAVAQRDIGLNGIEPAILEVVGANLLDQADSAAFLGQIDQRADPFVADHGERHFELVAAIAT